MVVLIALHDLNHALRFCNQAMVIANGTLVASGRSSDIITPALLRDVYRVEARIEPCSRGIGNVIVDGVTAQGRSFALPRPETEISDPSSRLALRHIGAN